MADLCKRSGYQGGPHEEQSGWCGLCKARADSRCPHIQITSRQRRRQAARDQRRLARRTA